MHRSGTSMATRALDLLGASLGDPEALMPPGKDNPAGYWENRYIKELDDELLATLGGAWDRPPVLVGDWAQDAELDGFRQRAATLLEQAFADHEGTGPGATGNGEVAVRAWKDPRLSLLLPFWRTVTPIAGTVVVVRDPLEVCASLGTRNDMPPASAALLWLRYVLAAAANDPEHLVVRYDDFFDDLPATLRRMAAHTGLAIPDDERVAAVRDHLDPDLHHHRRPAAPPPDADPVTAMAVGVWSGGQLDVGALDPDTRRAVGEGWLRSPADDAALTEARSKVTMLSEHLRARSREARALTARLEELDARGPAPSSGSHTAGWTPPSRGSGVVGPTSRRGWSTSPASSWPAAPVKVRRSTTSSRASTS